MYSKLARIIILFLTFNYQVFADEITIVGSVDQSLKLSRSNTIKSLHSNSATTVSDTKTIKLLEFQLSDKAKNKIYQDVQQALTENEKKNDAEPPRSSSKKVELGMNNVPVLDQGYNGTCVTFAATAAIDAALDKGDYISQLCLLQLGNYLEQQGKGYSGWNGSYGKIVLSRIETFGVYSKINQKKYSCGGYSEYPYYYSSSTPMTPEVYGEHAELVKDNPIIWETLFDYSDVFANSPKDTVDTVKQVKDALNAGFRVSFGVLLPRTDLGTVGAVGWHHYLEDTWVLSYDIAQELGGSNNFAGHEMVITGYDDNAVAMDYYGHRHHGLFTLRNSWGSNVADWGTFYMSYDYFKALAIEAYKVGKN